LFRSSNLVLKEVKIMVQRLGPMAFMAGVVLSVLAGFLLPGSMAVAIVVACLGIIVGLFNIQDKEVPSFLLAAIAFTTAAASLGLVFGQIGVAGGNKMLAEAPVAFFNYVATFAGTAAGVVAFKQIWILAKD
jgi:hypothetical protein